jgi:hypothetical protein
MSILPNNLASMSTTANLCDLLSSRFAPIQEALVELLAITELVALQQTCRTLSVDISDKLKSTDFNINIKLKHWFTDPLAFHTTQAKFNALILGRFPFHFMSRRTIQDDILYIACDEQPNAMKAFLKVDGYARCSRSRAEEKSLELIQHRSSEAGDPQYRLSLYEKIDANGETSEVMIWKDSTPVSTLLFRTAPTTADLHIVSWNKAYSLYPQRTMLAKEAYMLKKMDEETCEELSEDLKSLSDDGIDVKGVH